MRITITLKKKLDFSTLPFAILLISFLAFDIGLFASPSFYDFSSSVRSEENSKHSKLMANEFPPSLSIDTIVATEDCYQTGTASVVVSGGDQPYSYAWSNGGQSDKITGLSAGSYSVTITDINGMMTSSSVVVSASQYCASLPCGNIYTKLNRYTTSSLVAGALQYRFTFTPISGTAPIVVHEQPSNYIYFKNVSGLYYNTSYNWTVEVEYAMGVWGGLSASNCIITFDEPESQLPCGSSYFKFNKYTIASLVHNATNYKFTFVDSDSIVPNVEHIQTGNYIYFKNVPGLYYNTTYNWTVEVEYEVHNSSGDTLAWGPPSDPNCTITFEEPISPPPCGTSYTKLNRYTTTPIIHEATNYRFTFMDSDSIVPTVVHEQPSNYIYFNTVPGLYYNTTYKWTVEVEYKVYDISGDTTNWGPPSDSTCTITFEEPISPPPCGSSYTKLNRYTTTPIIHTAQNYRFTFIDIDSIAPTVIHEQPGNYIYFNTVPGLYYNTTYNWTVQVEYNVFDIEGNTTAWGPPSNSACPITFEEPTSPPPCGNSFANLNKYTTIPHIHNSTNYRFTFSETIDFQNTIERVQQSNYIYFNTVTGLNDNTTYFWKVEVQYEAYDTTTITKVWGPPSDSTCTITFGQPFFGKTSNDLEVRSDTQYEIDMKIYPNPARNSDVSIFITGNQRSAIKVYDTSGRLHYEKQNIVKDTLLEIDNLSPGTYFIRLQDNNRIINKKLIVI